MSFYDLDILEMQGVDNEFCSKVGGRLRCSGYTDVYRRRRCQERRQSQAKVCRWPKEADDGDDIAQNNVRDRKCVAKTYFAWNHRHHHNTRMYQLSNVCASVNFPGRWPTQLFESHVWWKGFTFEVFTYSRSVSSATTGTYMSLKYLLICKIPGCQRKDITSKFRQKVRE